MNLRPLRVPIAVALAAAASSGVAQTQGGLPFELKPHERIAFVGNSTGERMNLFGHFETMLHGRFPELELVVRNFCRPADEVGIRQRPTDYTKIDDPLAVFAPDTFLCFFGFNESFAGPAGIGKFSGEYEKFLDDYARRYGREGRARFVLISPIAFESTGNDFLPDGEAGNRNLKIYADAAREVARKRGLPFIDLFGPTAAAFNAAPAMQFTINGCHLNEAGDRAVAELLDRALFGTTNPAKPGTPAFEQLRAAVNDKSWVHLQDYRMLNGWYVYGGRRTWDTETFPREYRKIRAMAAVRDHWCGRWPQVARQSPSTTRKPASCSCRRRGLETPAGIFGKPDELRYLTPEESIAAMKVPEGFEVRAFASERRVSRAGQAGPDELRQPRPAVGRVHADVSAVEAGRPAAERPAVDFRGHQQRRQGRCLQGLLRQAALPDRVRILERRRARDDQPRLIWLKDTDGDDKADVVVHLLDGWATDDTHHTIGAFEWSHGGLLHMLEGVAMSTAVETPWGPQRNHGSPGCYVLDPRTLKVRHFVTPGYGNPWCYVFDPWGQGIVGDGTTAQQHWDSPLSGAQFSGRRGLNAIFDNEGMRPVVGSEFLRSRHLPDDVQGQFIYACVINMNGMTRVRDSRRRRRLMAAERLPDLLESPTSISARSIRRSAPTVRCGSAIGATRSSGTCNTRSAIRTAITLTGASTGSWRKAARCSRR